MSNCPECGAPLATDVVDGLCPRCLLQAGMAGSEEPAGSTPSPAWTPPSVASLNQRFAQLEVTELIGQGGMGAVYKARQPKLDRYVALKVLPPELGETPEFAERFAREARTLAKLSHPNIVGIHDFGDVDGLYYVVMEYVDGRSLRQLLAGGQLDPVHALHLVPQICDGLQYAHEQGVVHRDITPGNVLVDAKGRVRIADFGLAKLVAETQVGTLTGTHQVMGTPHYMAPEQMERPAAVDHRADIYALGVVFYEMLTGQLPIGRFPPPSEKAQVAPHIDAAVLKSLEREPEKRYDSALKVKQAVETPAAPVAARDGAAARRERATGPVAPAPRAYVGILVAGLVGFVAMFMTWGTITSDKFESLVYGEGRDFFGDKSSADHPFNDPFFKNSRVEKGKRNLRLQFDAWNSSLLGIPNGLIGILAAVLAAMAGITLGSTWRGPWLAYVIPAGYGTLHSLMFAITWGSSGGAPSGGCIVSVLALAGMLVAGFQLRPVPVRARRPRAAGRRAHAGHRRGKR